jgi:hypothetical protein
MVKTLGGFRLLRRVEGAFYFGVLGHGILVAFLSCGYTLSFTSLELRFISLRSLGLSILGIFLLTDSARSADYDPQWGAIEPRRTILSDQLVDCRDAPVMDTHYLRQEHPERHGLLI